MIRLLYITNGLSGSGGLERVLSVKASFLAEHFNYEVHVLTLNEVGEEPFFMVSSKVILHTIKVRGNNIRYVKEYLSGIRKIIRQVQPDVISVCDDGLKAFFLPVLLCKPCPMVYERHASKLIALNDDSIHGFRQVIMKTKFKIMDLFASTFNYFVILTEGNKKEWKLKNLKVISNPTTFYPDESSILLNKKVIAVGRQGFVKGYDRLLQVWQIVHQIHPDWNLSIYGKIQPEQELEGLAKKLNISTSISFFQPEKEILGKYLESSIFVLSSRNEGFGMVLIEAMACGVPCVSFDCPHGPADIIRDGEDGFLVKNGDIQSMAEKIITLIENENLRRLMGENAKKNVKRYLPENIVPQWDILFRELSGHN